MANFPQIPEYKITRILGEGGMSTVYLGVQKTLNRKVAIKVMEPLLQKDKTFARRFLKEAQTAAHLTHSNIVAIHDVGKTDYSLYIVMEYLENNLKKILSKNPASITPKKALKIVKSIARALDYAHSEGFIHRDIKPENIMFRKDKTPVLVDFGIARAIRTSTKLTKTGMSIGTPYYMSPEQARGSEMDGRSDIYSLGIVLYEMLTGQVPFTARDSVAIAIKHIQEPLPTLNLRQSTLKTGELQRFQAIIDGMLQKDPRKRPQSGRELIEFINQVFEGDPALFSEKELIIQGQENKPSPPAAEGPPPPGGSFLTGKSPLTRYILLPLLILVIIFLGYYGIKFLTRATSSPILTIEEIEFVQIPSGSFSMGSNQNSFEQPVHEVYLDTYYISRTEVTNGQFKIFTGDTGYRTEAEKHGGGYVFIQDTWKKKADASWRNPYFDPPGKWGLNHPVVLVSWHDATAYCRWLSRKSGRTIRLPTEAEWEKAARGTDARVYPWGKKTLSGNKLNFADSKTGFSWKNNNIYDGYKFTAPVGSYPEGASPYGVLDMAGNVWEWCADWYDKDYYVKSPGRDPQGPLWGTSRVYRGGSWCDNLSSVRCAYRYSLTPDYRSNLIGFRLVYDPEQ